MAFCRENRICAPPRDSELATPWAIVEAIAQGIGREVGYRPVERDGAARAAAPIAELV